MKDKKAKSPNSPFWTVALKEGKNYKKIYNLPFVWEKKRMQRLAKELSLKSGLKFYAVKLTHKDLWHGDYFDKKFS